MRRQFRGRSEAFVRSNDGEQGFWPSYADMMAAVALILFFVMLLSYIQNLITGNKLENTRAALADTEERLTATQTLLEEARTMLEDTKLELESALTELQSTKTELQSTKTELATTRIQLNEKREQVRSTEAQLAEVSAELTQTNQELSQTNLALSQTSQELSQKQAELGQMQTSLSLMQTELGQKQAELASQNAQLSAQSATITEQEAQIADMRRQMNALAVLRYDILKQIRDSMVATIGDSSKVSIGESGNIILNESILFDSGKFDIKPEAEPALDLLIDVFYRFLSDENNRSYVESIVISGHTDSDGSDESNRELSTNRANAVLGYLLTGKGGKLNVYAECFCAAGYGETRPIASNDTMEGKAANRRIEISITLKDDSIMALVESLAGN